MIMAFHSIIIHKLNNEETQRKVYLRVSEKLKFEEYDRQI